MIGSLYKADGPKARQIRKRSAGAACNPVSRPVLPWVAAADTVVPLDRLEHHVGERLCAIQSRQIYGDSWR
jgi:hypothetical protein